VFRALTFATNSASSAAKRSRAVAGFTYAVRHKMRPDNPARGVIRFADKQRDRRLSDEEYAALGAALQGEAERIWPPAVAAGRFLALAGWRSGEALGLKWSEVDLGRRTARLGDTKAGSSIRPL
jgi:integrase